MFSVLFEVHPKKEEWDAYLGFAKMLRPELERVKGFVHNIRYREAPTTQGEPTRFRGFLILDNHSRMRLLESSRKGPVSRRKTW